MVIASSMLFLTSLSAQDDLSLRDAISMAQSSPQAIASEAQVIAARGQVTQAGLGPNPRLYLQSEDLRPWAKAFDFPNQTEDYGYLGQTVELDGKRLKRVAVARADLRRAEVERQLQMQLIAGRVAGAYWGLVVGIGVRDLLAQDLKAVDEVVRYHRERVAAGAMRGVDLLRMEIERDRVQIALEAAERDITTARVDLFHQIGRPVSRETHLSDSLGTTLQLPRFDIAAAVAGRLDVVATKEEVASAEANVRLQRANAVPDPDVLGGYKRNSGNDTLYAAVQIPLPFHNRNQGEIARADAHLRLAKAHLAQAELTARADIEAAQTIYDHQRQIVEKLVPDMRSRAKQNLVILDDAYRTGSIDLLRYIDAERTEIEVEVNALRTLADLRQSIVRLQLAYGDTP